MEDIVERLRALRYEDSSEYCQEEEPEEEKEIDEEELKDRLRWVLEDIDEFTQKEVDYMIRTGIINL